jgi:hypothetical protein
MALLINHVPFVGDFLFPLVTGLSIVLIAARKLIQ